MKKEEPPIINLEPHEYATEEKPFCYQRDPWYAVTVIVLAYPVYWLVSTILEPIFQIVGLR